MQGREQQQSVEHEFHVLTGHFKDERKLLMLVMIIVLGAITITGFFVVAGASELERRHERWEQEQRANKKDLT